MNESHNSILGNLYQLAGYPGKPATESGILSSINHFSEKLNSTINSGYSCIFDWRAMRYLFMSRSVKNILGYSSDFFLENGYNFTLGLIHSEDILRLKDLHLAIFNFYYSVPAARRAELKFSYNLRVKTVNNEYIHILRQSSFIEFTTDGKPKLEQANIIDLTGFKCNNNISLAIHQLSDSGTYSLCHEQEFRAPHTNLTERERQVLELVRFGYTTKEIASHLFVTIETIKSHRKHIIAKTGACNMTAAINRLVNK